MDILQRYSNRTDILVDLQHATRQLERASKRPHVRRSVSSQGRVNRKWSMQDRFTDEQLLAIVQDRLSGLSQGKTSEKYGISESSVKRILRIYKAGAKAVDHAVNRQHEPSG